LVVSQSTGQWPPVTAPSRPYRIRAFPPFLLQPIAAVQMFFNALVRKGKSSDVKEQDVAMVVAIHNEV
jgi:hypothetical protein